MTARADIPPDTVGGLDLSDELIGEPTWRTAPPLAALVEAVRVEGCVALEDQPQWLVNGSLAARFLKQLTMQTPSTFYVRDPRTARHAVRLALWDNRQTTAATAMALLATAELNHTVTSLALR